MQIREATSADIPSIVKVLKRSLGEVNLPISEEILKFKHFDNPFGKSIILIALKEGNLIGVRSFMRWDLSINDLKFAGLRAVDTGILPEYQRMGIFRELNSAALEVAEKRFSFVFNTPNSKSLPANLKMGWKNVDYIKIKVIPCFLLKPAKKEEFSLYKISKNLNSNELRFLLSNYNEIQRFSNKFFTPKSIDFLEWRYERNPLQQYEIKADPDFYLAAYVKKHKYFWELRVVEHIYYNNDGLNKIKKSVNDINKRFNIKIISYSNCLSLSFRELSGNYGPILTYKNIHLNSEWDYKFLNLQNWGYSLGDLELF